MKNVKNTKSIVIDNISIDADRVDRSELHDLDKIYHSESAKEMRINADLMLVDLCNPYVLCFLAHTSAYHHAFYSHARRRFTAFKDLLRHDKEVRKSIVADKNHVFCRLLVRELNRVERGLTRWPNPGGMQYCKNLQQVLNIVKKCISCSRHKQK